MANAIRFSSSPIMASSSSSSSSSTNTILPSPKRQKISMDSVGEFVKVIVQPESNEPEVSLRTFNIVKNQVCKDSRYFHNICFGDWKKTRDADKPIQVIGLSPEIFSIFVTYVHHRDLSLAEQLTEVTAEVSKDENERIDQYEKRFQQLLKCHVLGRYIMADEFCNNVMDMILTDVKTCYKETKEMIGISTENIEFVYQHSTEEDTKLRNFMISWALLINDEDLREFFVQNRDSEAVQDFQLDVFFEMRKICHGFDARTGNHVRKPITEQDPCRYHVHADKKSSYSCTKEQKPNFAEYKNFADYLNW